MPECSIPGPLLFFLYVNDLFRALPSILTIMYANDTILLSSDTDFINLVNAGTTELKLFYDWALANRLSNNVDQTFYIIFGNKSVDNDSPRCLRLVSGRAPVLGVAAQSSIRRR